MAKYHQRTNAILMGPCLVLAIVLLSFEPVRAQHKYSYITSTTSSTTSAPPSSAHLLPQSGYYKPVQVIKAAKDEQENKTVIAAESAAAKIEALPTPARLTSDYKAYGLPAYNGPSEHSLWSSAVRRGQGAVDYTANSAGFVVSDLRPDASSNRGYDLTPSSARIHQYNSRPSPYRYHEKRSRSDYSPQDSAAQGSSQSHSTDDLGGYLKTAASETSHAEQSAQSGASFIPSRASVRRKPTYADKPQQYEEPQSSSYSFDPQMSKHFLKTHFRDNDYGGSSLMEAGEHMSASNDNELAQLAATMSELQSAPTSSTPEMFSQADLSQLSGQLDPNAYSLGSLGAASQIPAATAVPGVPAGAIVGAPGSQPPPGMKLAGYVTMAGPQQNMMNQMSAMNPMMRGPLMGSMGSPSMRYPGMMPPPMMPGFGPGPMGPNPMNPSLQQLIGSTFGQRPQQTAASNQNAQGSQASASSTSSTRSRFLSRLNPMNLFRRLRNRNQPKDDLKSLETMLTSESRRRPAFASFVRRMGEMPETDNDTIAQANSPFGLYRRSYGLSSLGYPSSPMRRGRRLHTAAARTPTYYEAESRPVSLMGSGNFEVIRGGYFPVANGDGQPAASNSADRTNTNSATNNNSETGLDPDDQNIFDDIFASGNPILGFQGFDHFGSSAYNNLAPSTQQKVEVKPDGQPTPASKSS